jgi:hypothetical protein
MRRTIICLTILISCLIQIAVANPEYANDRIWTGANGATFRGVFVKTSDRGRKVQLFNSAGKVISVGFDNLSEKDRKIVLILDGRAPAEVPPAAEVKKPMKQLPIANRSLIPERLPKDFGGTDGEAMVDALWVSLLWWNASEIVPIPKSGDFYRQAAWLHKELRKR